MYSIKFLLTLNLIKTYHAHTHQHSRLGLPQNTRILKNEYLCLKLKFTNGPQLSHNYKYRSYLAQVESERTPNLGQK